MKARGHRSRIRDLARERRHSKALALSSAGPGPCEARRQRWARDSLEAVGKYSARIVQAASQLQAMVHRQPRIHR